MGPDKSGTAGLQMVHLRKRIRLSSYLLLMVLQFRRVTVTTLIRKSSLIRLIVNGGRWHGVSKRTFTFSCPGMMMVTSYDMHYDRSFFTLLFGCMTNPNLSLVVT
jgi:hypothetical protein